MKMRYAHARAISQAHLKDKLKLKSTMRKSHLYPSNFRSLQSLYSSFRGRITFLPIVFASQGSASDGSLKVFRAVLFLLILFFVFVSLF